jgi:hypothetical protein
MSLNILPNARAWCRVSMAMQGSHTQDFTGKAAAGQVRPRRSVKTRTWTSPRVLRREDDYIAENTNLSAPGNDKTRKQRREPPGPAPAR